MSLQVSVAVCYLCPLFTKSTENDNHFHINNLQYFSSTTNNVHNIKTKFNKHRLHSKHSFGFDGGPRE